MGSQAYCYVKMSDQILKSLSELLDEESDRRSSFVEKYWKDVKDPLTVTIKGHLYIENLLTELISLVIPKSNLLVTKNTKFSDKVKIYSSLNISTGLDISGSLKSLNDLRNDFSHDLEKQLLLEDVEKIEKGIEKYLPEKKDLDSRLRSVILTIISYLVTLKLARKHFPITMSFVSNMELYSKDEQFTNVVKVLRVADVPNIIRSFSAKIQDNLQKIFHETEDIK